MINAGVLSDEILNCSDEVSQGVGSKCYLVNIQDIDKDQTVVADYKIDSIVYKTGAPSPFECNFMPDTTEVIAKMEKGAYRDGFNHDITIRIFANNTPRRLRAMELMRSRVAVIFETYTNDTSYWQIAGYELGLEAKNIEANYTDEETGGGWVIQLGCDDDFIEKDIPYLLDEPEPEPDPIHIIIAVGEIEGGHHGTIHATGELEWPYGFYLKVGDQIQYYDIQKIDDKSIAINLNVELPPGTYQYFITGFSGTQLVTAGLNYYPGTCEESDLAAGILTINSTVTIDRPLAFYLMDPAGVVKRYEIKRISGTTQVVNIGEHLIPGIHQYRILYADV